MAVKECYCGKLSPNKKSILGLRLRNQILYLLFIVSFVHVTGAEYEMTCSKAKSIFEKNKLLSTVVILEQPNSDADELCLNKGCCDASTRARFIYQARKQLENALSSELNKLADALAYRANRVNDFFQKLLQMSKAEFHAMFKRTYGMIYEQHSYVFAKLFEELERYYTEGDVEFDAMMDKFFGILYQKMFTVLNSQYSFDEKYLSCVNEHMREIKPFEDVPQKLSVQLRRAFVATRTFHKALQAGADVVRNMMQLYAFGRNPYLSALQNQPILARGLAVNENDSPNERPPPGVAAQHEARKILKVPFQVNSKIPTKLNPMNCLPQKEGSSRLVVNRVKLTSECVTAWARLRFCGSCMGDDTPACSRYCHNVLRGCLPAHADLGDNWDAYIEAIDKVADRLLGPFNIAMVVEPIDIKISEAIMSFQEHNQEISQKIFAGCGKPVLGGGGGGAGPFFAPDRNKRSIRSDSWDRDNDVDDFEIETSFESVRDDPMFGFRVPEIRRATQELAEQAKLRERFLQYMRGNMELKEYERYEHDRRRRDAAPEPAAASSEIDYRAFDFEGKRGSKKKKPSAKTDDVHGGRMNDNFVYVWCGVGGVGGAAGGGSAEWGGAALERLVRECRARLHAWRRYWAQLPALLCAPASVTSAPCFNGTALASYTVPPAGEGGAALASNPEVRGGAVPGGVQAARTMQERLRALTARLRDAYNGLEVQWRDTGQYCPSPPGTGTPTTGTILDILHSLTTQNNIQIFFFIYS
ncbi:unnamed protein product [Diatraea saccharalis]|uniref:Glypican-6 n=1 Tax=Diatraea saccharalis TaxID=40085 RepID=A0A9P0G1S8_9NEOP|nr:unnamed protein product [Diatraea saccharalis]